MGAGQGGGEADCSGAEVETPAAGSTGLPGLGVAEPKPNAGAGADAQAEQCDANACASDFNDKFHKQKKNTREIWDAIVRDAFDAE